jgi:hypothetical protein
MEYKDLIMILGLLVVVVSVINLSVTIIKITGLNDEMTGYATGTGYVNLTVMQNIAINLSRDQINFGSGVINTTDGCQNATMWTRGDADPIVECGNFTRTGGPKGIIIQNLGSVNFSLNVSAQRNATEFFGGTDGSYQWNFSNLETDTCNTINNGTGMNLSLFNEVAKNTQYTVCKQFGYIGSNEMYMDVYLRIPSNNNITDGVSRWDTITFTASAAI